MKRRTFRAEREFGLLVGVVFALLGSWWLLPLGALLVFFGLIWPRALLWPNRAWMSLAAGLSFVTTRMILGLVFFLVVTPIGVVKRLMGWDPLGRRSGHGARGASYWKPYSERQRNPRHYEKMF